LEIKDYVKALEGKGRIVAAVAILAGFLAAVIFIFEPQPYHATASVALPIPPSTTTSAIAAVSEAYADFSGAITTDVVAQRAATDVGVPASEVKGHVEVTRLAGGNVAEVTYTGTDRDHASQIAAEASKEALALIVSARLAPLEQQLTLAQQAVEEANTEFEQFVSTEGVLTDRYFTKKQNEIDDLRNRINNARAKGQTQLADDLQVQFEEKNAKIGTQIAEFNRLTTTRNSANEAYSNAQAAELAEKGLLDSVQLGGQIPVSDPTGSSRLTGLIKAVVPAVVVATGLAIALIVLLEVVGPARLPTRQRPAWPGRRPVSDEPEAHEAPGVPRDEDDEDEEPPRDPAGRVLHTRT
jgi:hypothetical protein